MDQDVYYGYILKGDVRGAISYIKQFPEQHELYQRLLDLFVNEKYISYAVDPDLNDILTAYQRYYRDVFYLCLGKDSSAEILRKRLEALLGIPYDTPLSDIEQTCLVELFQSRGLHFMGGKSNGYYGAHVWQSAETVSYDVELPDGVQTYSVKLLDGFITRGWLDHLSFGKLGTGGWANGDGYINCVRSAWDLEGESFRVSLLKHEAQHARDLEISKDISSEDLEYRAKLVELIYSRERNLLQEFAREADGSGKSNAHAAAAYRIVKDLADVLGLQEIEPSAIPIERIQAAAKLLFENSGHLLSAEG